MHQPKQIAILWESESVEGSIEVSHGTLTSASTADGQEAMREGKFAISGSGGCRIEMDIEITCQPKALPARVTLRTLTNPFTFFLRDVFADHPIFVPTHGAAITTADDKRSYADIARDIARSGFVSDLQRIESEPEESFETAAPYVRDLKGITWLGLSRDMRIFEVNPQWEIGSWGTIHPRFHGVEVPARPEDSKGNVWYYFVAGRGAGCEVDVTRRLEEGILPILHGTARDGDILYNAIFFTTYERTPLRTDTLRGSHYLVADGHAVGHMFTPEQQAQYDALNAEAMGEDEEVVLHARITAVNTAPTPRYAWFRAPMQGGGYVGFDSAGPEYGVLASGRVYCVSRLNGEPLQRLESSVLVAPGESAVLEFAIPHRPVPRERADALAQSDFDTRWAECRAFWKSKLEQGASVELPEPRVNEMVKAGLLHLDLATYGREPDGTLAPTIGRYAPIGSESTPIVLFLDNMGWHDTARRAMQFFLDKQHDDGFIQNFGGYMVETGGALYQFGEHYRLTHDLEWARAIAPKALKSCQYLIDWRRRNEREELRGRGYGMLDGKVADPPDPFHYFMNSGYACMGLMRTAEWMQEIDPAAAADLRREADAFRADIRASFEACIARSPVVPLGDGTWAPTAPPWAEATGLEALHAEGGLCYSHHSFGVRDSLIGPLWLIFQEILDPREPWADALLRTHAALFTTRNAAPCQPYYTRHDYAHLRRGEVKAFLKTWYNQFASLADRQTYSFWEHYFHASPHKTHEEGWFLMQTRWMLAMEEGDRLRLLPGIPRVWLTNGKKIQLQNIATYFGPVSLEVKSNLDHGAIEATWTCDSGRRPRKILLRLPHPQGLHAREAIGGVYDHVTEAVEIETQSCEGSVLLRF